VNIEEIVARAAPPPERGGPGPFEPVPTSPESLALRREHAIAAFGSFENLAAHAEALDMDPDDWLGRLGDVRLAGAAPDWARAFREMFERLGDGEFPFAEVRRWASAEVDAQWPEGLPHGPEALDGPLNYLGERFGVALAPTFVVERQLKMRPDWAGRFRRSPALAYVLGRLAADWLADLGRIAGRAAADRSLLAGTFFGGADPGALLRIAPGLGDPHFAGRSVAILHFERGAVVYKPKDLRIAAAVGEIVRRMGDIGLAPPETVLRGEYAWEPLYEASPIADEDEADAFFRALGAWLAILQGLGGNDFWFDNLIAQGPIPRFIDFETASQPPVDWTMKLPPELSAPAAPLRLTPVGVGILPFLMPTRDGEDPTDIGCLSRPGEHRTPLPDSAGGLVTWNENRFAPRYASGVAADAADHFDAFEQGYLAVAHTLALPSVQEDTLATLRKVADAPIRVIRLDTWTCYRMIRLSLAPRHLSDGVWRELTLHGAVPVRKDMVGVLREAAVRDLRRLDVPFFQTRLDSRDLFGVEGERHVGYYGWNAISEARDRLHALAGTPIGDRAAWVRSGFGLRLGNPPRGAAVPADYPPADPGDLLGWADEIATAVAGEAVPGIGGGPTWLGFMHDVFTGVRWLGPLGIDILSGRAGVALALAELARSLDRRGLADLAREALLGAGREFVRAPRSFLDAGAGYAVGVGGLVAALAREPALRPLALEAYAVAASHEVWMHSGADFVSGLAGWREAAHALSKTPPTRHGRARPYAPSARPRLSRWLDPENATPPCADRRTAVMLRKARDRDGRWLADCWLDDRHAVSGIDGLPALALCFSRLAGSDGWNASTDGSCNPPAVSPTPGGGAAPKAANAIA
jgi:hypothetical protein